MILQLSKLYLPNPRKCKNSNNSYRNIQFSVFLDTWKGLPSCVLLTLQFILLHRALFNVLRYQKGIIFILSDIKLYGVKHYQKLLDIRNG